MINQSTQNELVKTLLVAVETQLQLINEDLINARQAFNDKEKRNFYGVIGSISSTPTRLEDMQTTIKTLINMAKEPTIAGE